MPALEDIDTPALLNGAGFQARRSAQALTLYFPPLRASAPAIGLLGFALFCALLPALGLSALWPLQPGNAAAMMGFALIGGFALPFIVASVVFTGLSIYLLANSLHVEIRANSMRTQRRVFGLVTKRRKIARADITGVEPRVSARYQNVFSSTPRYALVATHRDGHRNDLVLAEDLVGQSLMIQTRALICAMMDLN